MSELVSKYKVENDWEKHGITNVWQTHIDTHTCEYIYIHRLHYIHTYITYADTNDKLKIMFIKNYNLQKMISVHIEYLSVEKLFMATRAYYSATDNSILLKWNYVKTLMKEVVVVS